MFPVCEELDVAYVAFSTMANGFLTGKYTPNTKFEGKYDYRAGMPQYTEAGNIVLTQDEIAGDYDGFVFGTPVHWGAASGGLTSFMDRAFYADLCGGGNRFLMKSAAAVVSARRAGTKLANILLEYMECMCWKNVIF